MPGMTAADLDMRIADERLAGRLGVEYLLDDLALALGVERDTSYGDEVRKANEAAGVRLRHATPLDSYDSRYHWWAVCDGCGQPRVCEQTLVVLGDGEIDDRLYYCVECWS